MSELQLCNEKSKAAQITAGKGKGRGRCRGDIEIERREDQQERLDKERKGEERDERNARLFVHSQWRFLAR